MPPSVLSEDNCQHLSCSCGKVSGEKLLDLTTASWMLLFAVMFVISFGLEETNSMLLVWIGFSLHMHESLIVCDGHWVEAYFYVSVQLIENAT